jgi:hypothetical protein
LTGRGCICTKGYAGTTCEIDIRSLIFSTTSHTTVKFSRTSTNTTLTSIKKSNSKPKLNITASLSSLMPITAFTTVSSILTTKSDKIDNSSTLRVKPIKTSKRTPLELSTSYKASYNRKLESELTTPQITSCENGGLLVDNICICLNQFTGVRCEIAPRFNDGLTRDSSSQYSSADVIDYTDEYGNLIINSNSNNELDLSTQQHLTTVLLPKKEQITINDNLENKQTKKAKSFRSTKASSLHSYTSNTAIITTTLSLNSLASINEIKSITSNRNTTKKSVPNGVKTVATNLTRQQPLVITEANKINSTSPCPSSTSNEQSKQQQQQSDFEDEEIPLLSINRYSRKHKNNTTRKNIFWPWFGRLLFIL